METKGKLPLMKKRYKGEMEGHIPQSLIQTPKHTHTQALSYMPIIKYMTLYLFHK